MKKYLMMALMMVVGLSGCATHGSLRSSFADLGLDAKLKSGKYEQRVDNFIVIVDGSYSMKEREGAQSRYVLARNLSNAINHGLPGMPLKAGIISFGTSEGIRPTVEVLEFSDFSKAQFEQALASVNKTGWTTSPMDKAIEAAGRKLANVGGTSAIVIVADGICLEKRAIAAAKELKAEMGERLVINTVQVGSNEGGRALMQELAVIGGGVASTSAELAKDSNMGLYIERVFLNQLEAVADSDGDGVPDYLDECPNTPAGIAVGLNGCPPDSDGDGVPDYLDICPDTPANTIVDDNGCPLEKPKGAEDTGRGSWIFNDVLFDTNKWDIKPGLRPIIDEVVRIMNENPNMKMEIQGHTDSRGSDTYNLSLSTKRAEAVKQAIVAKGIAAERLYSNGYGEIKPIADNNTTEGRFMNRRVEFVPVREL